MLLNTIMDLLDQKFSKFIPELEELEEITSTRSLKDNQQIRDLVIQKFGKSDNKYILEYFDKSESSKKLAQYVSEKMQIDYFNTYNEQLDNIRQYSSWGSMRLFSESLSHEDQFYIINRLTLTWNSSLKYNMRAFNNKLNFLENNNRINDLIKVLEPEYVENNFCNLRLAIYSQKVKCVSVFYYWKILCIEYELLEDCLHFNQFKIKLTENLNNILVNQKNNYKMLDLFFNFE